jgi:hypothetical protein
MMRGIERSEAQARARLGAEDDRRQFSIATFARACAASRQRPQRKGVT